MLTGINWYTTINTTATADLITVEQAKDHLRATEGDDRLIRDYIKAASKIVRNRVPGGRSYVNQTIDLYLDRFPSSVDDLNDPWRSSRLSYADWQHRLEFPLPPLQSVTTVAYFDSANSSTTVASTDYVVHTPTDAPGFITPTPDTSWPSTKRRPDAVKITYVAGYGSTDNSNVPYNVRQATQFLVSHFYENREPVVVGTVSKELEFGVDALLATNGYGFYG